MPGGIRAVTSMTSLQPDFKGRLLRTIFADGLSDRVPIVEAGIDLSIKERFLGRPIQHIADEIEFWQQAGYDFIPLEAGLRTVIDAAIHHEQTGRFESEKPDPAAIAAAKSFAIDRLSPLQLTASGPTGNRRSWAPAGKGIIRDLADLEQFPWPAADDFDLSALQLANEHLPSGMGTLCFSGAVFSSVLLMLGFESAFIEMATETEFFQAITRKVIELQYDVVERLVRQDLVGGIWVNDDLGHRTGTLVNPKLLRKYFFPYYRELRLLTKTKNLPLLLHSDGRIVEVLPDLVEIGFNAVHPIDPNCMSMQETRDIVGSDVCLIGNLSLTYPLGTGSPEDVARETEALIRSAAPAGAYCLSSGNSIPEYIPYENWKTMRDTALHVGVYPIGKE
jgi:uroporphyrinogen decarboxylase